VQPGRPLPPEQLYRRCNPDLLDSNTSAELESQVETPGQKRAMKAIDFATEIELGGHPKGMGTQKSTAILK